MTAIVEFRPNQGVIGCSGCTARFQVHVANATNGGQRSCCQNVVDAPSPIVREGIPEVIPVGVLHPVGVEFPKHINESPGDRVAIGVTCVNVEVRIDRKSTRLNSSHLGISYAVFCLKKNKQNKNKPTPAINLSPGSTHHAAAHSA